MNAGLQHLKESKWDQASKSFKLVINLAPDYAPAYMGALCAELAVTEETLRNDFIEPIDERPFFKSAVEHADPAYKQQIQGYAAAIKARIDAIANSGNNQDGHKKGERLVLTIQGVEYAFRWCPSGTFNMGSPAGESGRGDNETQHWVTLRRGFWLLETEVTQMMWASVMGDNPSHFEGMKRPVKRVNWYKCQEYIKKLNTLLAGTPGAPSGFKFSLPTEVQWEYACRAGTTTAYSFGNTLTDKQANFGGNVGKTSEVGSYPANAWGLHDMHGNVWEWCLDWYGDYPNSNVTDPTGAVEGLARVCRGGYWGGMIGNCRSALRHEIVPKHRSLLIGLRVSLVSSN
jgi:formylglycine-generating enzyme required for sulfatase activity